MQRTTISVLGHTVECNTGNIIPDQSLLDDIHDMIYEEISAGATSGEGPMLCEIGEPPLSTEVEIDVIWKVVNPWKEIASKLYYALITETAGYLDREDKTVAAIKEYEQLIQEDGK